MMTKRLIVFFVLFLPSCSVFKKTAKQELTSDVYFNQSDKQKVYVDIQNDDVFIYPLQKKKKFNVIDSSQTVVNFPKSHSTLFLNKLTLTKRSFDVDFITTPLKFRFAQKGVPAQLNANLNGSIYLGMRFDDYKLSYKVNPLSVSHRKITHFGYSFGIITGIGNALVSPTTTNDFLTQEYDGVVWNKGAAIIFGINAFTVGVNVGFDNLLNKHNKYWIYENKPWKGLCFGLNLN